MIGTESKNRILNEQQIKDCATANIADIASQYANLKHKGYSYFGLCPLPDHDEKTGSFVVTPSKNIYKCFGCGKSGDAINLVEVMEGKTYREALERIAALYNINVEYSSPLLNPQPIQRQIVRRTPKPVKEIEPSYTPHSLMESTKKHFDRNLFVEALIKFFNINIVSDILEEYHIGTKKDGSVIFWQQDVEGNVRGGKVILYNRDTAKRVKDRNPNWMHAIAKMPNYNLVQTFFGAHLLTKDTLSPVAIFESEKSSCIASFYLKGAFICIAAGGKGRLGDIIIRKAEEIAGRDVVLFPDLSAILPEETVREMAKKEPGRYNLEIWEFDKGEAYNEWKHAAEALKDICNTITVSDALERTATNEEREAKLDMADYMLRVNYRTVLKQRLEAAYDKVEQAGIYNYNEIREAARVYLRGLGTYDNFQIDQLIEQYTVNETEL